MLRSTLTLMAAGFAATAMANEGDGVVRGSAGAAIAPQEQTEPLNDSLSADLPAPKRALMPQLSSLTAVGMSAEGAQVRAAASDIVRAALMEPAAAAGPRRLVEDPAFAGNTRQVFGPDDRVQITTTDRFPFRAIGYLQMHTPEGKVTGCSGTLIGPRTVLTAAHCLYNHESKTWRHTIEFFPGLRQNGEIPYGAYAFEQVWILEGYLTNYIGYYGSVVPWDLGVVILKERAGDSAGWLTIADNPGLGAFTANIVGYPGDKPFGTMWRASCDVLAENVLQLVFRYNCDTYPGSSGSAVYDYDPDLKQRVVYGVNVAENPNYNTAVRLNAGYLAWVKSLIK